jgi:hypothetical protein
MNELEKTQIEWREIGRWIQGRQRVVHAAEETRRAWEAGQPVAMVFVKVARLLKSIRDVAGAAAREDEAQGYATEDDTGSGSDPPAPSGADDGANL